MTPISSSLVAPPDLAHLGLVSPRQKTVIYPLLHIWPPFAVSKFGAEGDMSSCFLPLTSRCHLLF